MKYRLARIELLESRIAPAFAAVIELSTLNGTNGFRVQGAAAGDSLFGVSDAGDLNHDGFADVVVTGDGIDANGTDTGAAYVIFGKASGFPSTFLPSSLNGTNGFKISGSFAAFVKGAGSVGDVNGDGIDDLIVNAGGGIGSYVIYGKTSGFSANVNLSTVTGTAGFKITGAGNTARGLGDVNGDGFDDVMVEGGYGSGPQGTYVVFGKAAVFGSNINVSSLTGSNGFKINAPSNLTRAGDVNGDGFDDLIAGHAYSNVNGKYSGTSYVIFGKATGFAANVDITTVNGSNGYKLHGVTAWDESGLSVGAAGDVNGDGVDDLIIGAPGASPNGHYSGASYVVFGHKGAYPSDFNLSSLSGGNGFKISGVAIEDFAGAVVSAAGDVNGDGFDDVVVLATGADPNGDRTGASYVVFGKASGFAANLELSSLNGSNGFKINGGSGKSYQMGVSNAGDVNGDGLDDIMFGKNNSTGVSYVIFGQEGITINVSDATASEGDAGATALAFTVSLSEALTSTVSVDFKVTDGTAVAGSDFAAFSTTTLTFAPGEVSKIVTINVIGDVLYENNESFSVALSNPVDVLIKDGAGVGTIVNDDAPPIISVSDGTTLEGDPGTSSLVFAVSLSAASGLPATVRYAIADGTAVAGTDFTAVMPGTLTFAPGETTKTVTVEVLGDTSIEDHEQLSLVLSEAVGATIGNGTATGTILNDDTAVHISGPGSLLEGNLGTAAAIFTLTLEKASALPVTVNYAAVDGTALAGSDFTAPALGAQITFAPGETTKTITIDVLGDAGVEMHESFSIAMSGPLNATLENESAVATILNDDTRLQIDDASVLEGHGGVRALTFTVSLAAASALPVEVKFASSDGTATGGGDYIAPVAGTISFTPGETTKTITVEVVGDIDVESSETLALTLSEGVNAAIERATGLGTILDDDVTLLSKRKATFNDVDGDLVQIKVSKGTLKVEDFTIVPSGQGAQLALVDFRNEAELAGANLSITAKRAAGTVKGPRWVDVGYINASGIDLGAVVVKGDLGQIDAGNELSPKPGLASLNALSLGWRGIETQLPGGSLVSDINGAVKVLHFNDGMQDAILSISGDLGTVVVGGDILGSGIHSDGRIGTVKIAGDVMATSSNLATLTALGVLTPVSLGKAMAIRSIEIGGSVDHALILAGYDRSGTAVNAAAGIGEITVGSDWNASSLAAGASAGLDGFFGNEDDRLIADDNPIVGRIASVIIKGAATGSSDGTGHYGFIAKEITAFKSAGTKLTLTSGSGNDLAGMPIGASGNLTAREVA